MAASSEMYAEIAAADVVVVGCGPAGIAAATCAAERGLLVIVVDRGLEPGGQIWRHVTGGPVPRAAATWLRRLEKSGARVIRGASVVDVRTDADGFEILADVSGRPLRIWGASLILATGARELFIPFDGWTLPGVVGIGGAQALLKSGASFAGKRVIIAGSGPLMLPVAASLAHAGARVVRVAEQASRTAVTRFASGLWKSPSLLLQAARYRARFITSAYSTGTWVTAAHGTERVESVTVTDGRRNWRDSVDMLCTGYGLVPNTQLARLLGCETRTGGVVVDTEQRTSIANVFAVGEATGIGGAPLAIVEGRIAAAAVGVHTKVPGDLLRRRAALIAAAQNMLDAFSPRAELRSLPGASTIVCRCEDVPYGSVQGAACSRQAKLYTRAGMGPCQGRTCMPGLEFLLGWQPDTVRPPVEPTSVSVLSSEVAGVAIPSLFPNSSVGEAYQ
jgi:NADPH-dependent 2,4-dienoyl-CoA reductase/sulfur reductase-like enzyme